ncbi:MAG TPA: DUF6152 family protein [Hyphomicrobiales bacterium]|nr:DUF6152 family protein [Hyphomicrobiales bacterium]
MKDRIGNAARVALTALTLCMMVGRVEAHHSFSAEFDADVREALTGVITEVRYSNPHVRYRIDVENADGRIESWELQASSVTALREQNWNKDSVQVGDKVNVEGQRGRNNALKLFIRGVEMADGRLVGQGAGDASRAQPNALNASADRNYGFGDIAASARPIDITGYWNNRYKFRTTVDDLEPKPTPFTAEGRAAYERHGKYDDYALRCLSYGLPRLFGNPYNMTIYDAGTHYLFLYVDHNSPRHIWMDGRQPEASTPVTSSGFSAGRWEGKELVIETTHLLPGWLDGSGLPMSGEGTRTVERYSFSDDGLSMDRVMTIYDPYYSAPLTRVRGSARSDNLDVHEQESCDPTGYFSDLNEAGLLEKYLDPQQYLNP